MSLFDSAPLPFAGDEKRPLAERMRPERLEDFVGQQHILGPGKPLRTQIERDELQSMILWGPPGAGSCSLTVACTFFAIRIPLRAACPAVSRN